MNRPLVFAENKTLFLDTSMTQTAFTKSRMADRLDENGWLAEKTDGGWKFSPWTFSGTRQNECNDENLSPAARRAMETILFEGPAFSGRTLKALFDLDFSKELGETEISFVTYAAGRVCSVLEEAAKQKIDVSNIGAGGIFVSADYSRIIFLPRELFGISMECAGKQDAAEYNGFFINPQLKDSAAINYTQSVIAYRMLTGTYPFTQTDSMQRSWDITDHNYVPLKNMVWALDEKLSFFVDNALQRKSKIISHGKKKGEKKRSLQEKISSTVTEPTQERLEKIQQDLLLSFPLKELYRETGLTEKGEIPAGGHVSSVIRKGTISPDQFDRQCQKEKDSFKKRLAKKRWFRKNRTKLSIAGGLVLAVAVVVLIFTYSTLKNPTSKSLTSLETVQMYYSGLNCLDVNAVKGCSGGKGGDKFTEIINNVFVAAKTRSTYNARLATVSPAEWFCFNFEYCYNIFGLSNLFIDKLDGDIFFKGPAKNTNPKSITTEYGSSLTEGTTKDYVVHYSLVHNEGEDSLYIIDETDEIHLLFYHGRWLVTNMIPHENSVKEIKFSEFKEDFKKAWESTGENPKATAALLRDSYDWIPTDLEIDGGQKATDSERNPFEE